MLRQGSLLKIAVVAPQEPCALAEHLAHGLASRGHRVRLYRSEPGCDRLVRRLRAEVPDVVSDLAGDPWAFAAVEGLPVLHTLLGAPSTSLLDACSRSRAWFATPSSFLARLWQRAGLERIHVIPGGLPECRGMPAVVRPLAVVTDRAGALAALRAGLGISMPGMPSSPRFSREELARKLAHAAVCIVPPSLACAFDPLAAQAQLAGCPVVGYAEGPLAEIVEDGVSGILVAPGDEPALAAAARRAAALDRHAVRASARRRLAFAPMLARYESELRAIARRSAVRLVA
jgi:glycosyltransferase involved in cell wall biosynthesis